MSYSQRLVDAIMVQDLDLAEQMLELALAEDDQENLLALSDYLYQAGLYHYLKEVALHLSQFADHSDGVELILAELAFEEGQVEEALDYLLAITSDSEVYPESLLLQADIYLTEGLPEVAEQKLIELNDRLGRHDMAFFALAEFYFSQQRYNQAIHYYEELMDMGFSNYSSVDVTFRLAEAYSAIGYFEQAETLYLQSIDHDDQVDKQFQLGLTYLQMEEDSKAITALTKAQAMDPTYTSLYRYLSQAQLNLGQTDQALATIDQGLEYDQMQSDLYRMKAQIYDGLGDKAQAIQAYEEALDREPTDLMSRRGLATSYFDQGQSEEVLKLVDQADHLDLLDENLLWLKARALNEEEEFEEARKAYDKAYSLLQNDPDFLEDYMVFLREDGQWPRLSQVVEALLALQPDHGLALNYRLELTEIENE